MLAILLVVFIDQVSSPLSIGFAIAIVNKKNPDLGNIYLPTPAV